MVFFFKTIFRAKDFSKNNGATILNYLKKWFDRFLRIQKYKMQDALKESPNLFVVLFLSFLNKKYMQILCVEFIQSRKVTSI
jgi:hypothetical protein